MLFLFPIRFEQGTSAEGCFALSPANIRLFIEKGKLKIKKEERKQKNIKRKENQKHSPLIKFGT